MRDQSDNSKSQRIFRKLCLCFAWAIAFFILLACIAEAFDNVIGVDRTYRIIGQKRHPVTRDYIYERLSFKEPSVDTISFDIESFIYSSDSIQNDGLRERIDSIYRVAAYTKNTNSYTELLAISCTEGLPHAIQDFFLNMALKVASSKYDVLSAILQKYINEGNVSGVLAIDSLALEWKWDLGIMDYRYRPQDSLRTECLYYIVNHYIPHSKEEIHLSDSIATLLFQYSNEGYYASRQLTDNYSPICLYFQEVRAKYAYQINNPRADKYTDQLIERSKRWDSFFSSDPHLYAPGKGGEAPEYYFHFFRDPLYIRYKSLLQKKKYRKAELILNTLSSKTGKRYFDPDDPYCYVHDTLQPVPEIDYEDLVAYAKYDLACISENARIRYLRGNSDAPEWMTGAYLTGVNYLSPTESIFGSLKDYLFNSDLLFADLTPYMSVNYNNDDPRWVYNTALFLKGTGTAISSLIENTIQQSGWEDYINLFNTLKTEKVFFSKTRENDLRYDILDALLYRNLHNSIKKELSFCFQSYLDIQQGLSENECAVEIVKVPSLDFSNDYYKAIVLRKDIEHPILISLASSEKINNAILSGRVYGETNNDLYSLIWKPLKRYVNPGDVVYYAPDGALCSINIAAIVDEENRRLMDSYSIRQCVSTKDVCTFHDYASFSAISLFGGVNYDDDSMNDASHISDSSFVAYRGIECDTTREGWSYLPGTEEEVLYIDGAAKDKGLCSDLNVGPFATEFKFKSLTGCDIDILHIATHGFYYNRMTAKSLTFFDLRNIEDNPLNRCGLILSGGQKAWLGEPVPPSQEDGILLGSEIARMDLSSVDIVVLSACNTGLGDITYEGVLGLQKAFRQAGVNSIVMTLNKVDDAATLFLMKNFYQFLFSGVGKRDAFNQAISIMRNDSRYSDPKYWAPFVMLD